MNAATKLKIRASVAHNTRTQGYDAAPLQRSVVKVERF
jgi:hypothetical protein